MRSDLVSVQRTLIAIWTLQKLTIKSYEIYIIRICAKGKTKTQAWIKMLKVNYIIVFNLKIRSENLAKIQFKVTACESWILCRQDQEVELINE